jgi:hypothetical protein
VFGDSQRQCIRGDNDVDIDTKWSFAMPSHPAEPSISLSLRLPLPARERIIRLQRITGRTARDVVCEATRMMEEQLKLEGPLAQPAE